MNIHELMEASNIDDYNYAMTANGEAELVETTVSVPCGHPACAESKTVAMGAWEVPGGFEVLYGGQELVAATREDLAHVVWDMITKDSEIEDTEWGEYLGGQ